MSREIKWMIEDNVVALYLAMYGNNGLKYKIDDVEKIISNTISHKKGFRLRVKNYLYIVSGGKKGLDAGNPNGIFLYKKLYSIFKSFSPCKFRDYVNMILEIRNRMKKHLV